MSFLSFFAVFVNKSEKTTKIGMDNENFLNNDLFLCWRIRPTKRLDAYWDKFVSEYPELRGELEKAIAEFEEIRHKAPSASLSKEENTEKDKLYHKISQLKKSRAQRRRIYAYSSAAAVLLIAAISTLFITNHRENQKLPNDISIGAIMEQDRIQLFSGEETLNMNNNSLLRLSSENSATIEDSLSKTEIKLNTGKMNKMVVPFGKRATIILADGSTVHLNSGTEMDFPAYFSGNTRQISIQGEIFIEVAKQGGKPFIIHTPNSQIQVTGTSFNVSSYADEGKEAVVLVNGSVRVNSRNRSIVLRPGEMAEVRSGNISSTTVDVSDHISWKDGFMQFNETPLNDVLKKIGRYYNVKFLYRDDLNLETRTCSGKLFLSNDLNDVLKAFSQMAKLKCETDNNQTIRITAKETNNKK